MTIRVVTSPHEVFGMSRVILNGTAWEISSTHSRKNAAVSSANRFQRANSSKSVLIVRITSSRLKNLPGSKIWAVVFLVPRHV